MIGLALLAALRWYGRAPEPPAAAPSPPVATGEAVPRPETRAAATPTPSPRAPSQARLEDYLRAQDPQADWKVHRDEDGRVRGILGGRLTVAGPLPGFLSALSPYLIGQSPEFREEAAAAVDGPLAATRTFRQHAAGYEVYGAFARVSVPHGDDAVTEVSADLRPVDRVDTAIRVELRQAEELLQEKYASRGLVELAGTPRPLVFGRDPADNRLVWQFRVVVTKPRRAHYEVLVNARDGAIAAERPVLRR